MPNRSKDRPDEPYYPNLAERAKRGEYTLADPMDYMILGHLNEEGTMFAGVYQLGHTAVQIRKDVFKNEIGMNILAPRFSTLRIQGLVTRVVVPGQGGKHSYQRTKLGKKVYEEWRGRNGSQPQTSVE